MGAAISALRENLQAADRAMEEKKKQDLEIMQRMVDAQLDKYEADLNAKFLAPDATAKTEVPGIRALRRTHGISGAIESFFGAAEGGDTKSQLLNGFKVLCSPAPYFPSRGAKPCRRKVPSSHERKHELMAETVQKTVTTALNVFLGNASAGQKDESKYFVYMHHNAIVRVDVKLWRWNFVGTGFSDTYKSVMGYIICLSVVDIAVLKTAEFVYLISEYAGDSEDEVEQYCEAMGKMYNAARKLKQAQAIGSPSD
ncbi:MAG: hypothetical protein Q9169_002367 [Polycauliona sp. 2 TL-2023]